MTVSQPTHLPCPDAARGAPPRPASVNTRAYGTRDAFVLRPADRGGGMSASRLVSLYLVIRACLKRPGLSLGHAPRPVGLNPSHALILARPNSAAWSARPKHSRVRTDRPRRPPDRKAQVLPATLQPPQIPGSNARLKTRDSARSRGLMSSGGGAERRPPGFFFWRGPLRVTRWSVHSSA